MAVIEGRGPAPALVLSLALGLPDTSLTVALASGGRDHYGWGVDRHMAADTFDAINANTRATGNWAKGKAPKLPQWPRPKSKPKAKTTEPGEKKKPVSVADIYKQYQRR
ncbi:hypothetical protein M2302_002230 [Micromonospora sp. A200]|uniref:hypothetical protein n=1 Tax=Micromonospora sp. A200 TaxID=2940568 RepID=UPI002475E37C|nr:hypothetical protein [Micromonospora sp. A200]MDH6462055.1 hypothetical protein [Micromonospora sp. A200]